MAAAFSLVLSKGTHLIDDGARTRVLEAIEAGARVVEIDVDRYHDGACTTATIVTAHVVALFPLDDDEATLATAASNVTPLVRRA
jgi:hypothetical protein